MALSIILHALALSRWLPNALMMPFEYPGEGKASGSLAVRLASPPHRPLPPDVVQRPPSAPRVLAHERLSPSIAISPPADAARPSVQDDLASYIEARRRARGPAPASEPSPAPAPPPAESEQQRDNRIAAERLGLTRTPGFGANQNRGGGIFQVERVGYDDAEFFFFGWNKDIKRNSRQMIEVRRGDNATMEIAVVRKMIAIIREYSNDDFIWESRRLGRDLSLSARMADNAGLEDFMMREFFPDYRSRQ